MQIGALRNSSTSLLCAPSEHGVPTVAIHARDLTSTHQWPLDLLARVTECVWLPMGHVSVLQAMEDATVRRTAQSTVPTWRAAAASEVSAANQHGLARVDQCTGVPPAKECALCPIVLLFCLAVLVALAQ